MITNAVFFTPFFTVVEDRLPCSKAPRSQWESPNQCMSYSSHSLLILPLKFMLLFRETPYCGPRCLPDRRVTVTQECWGRCQVIPPKHLLSLPRPTSIATAGQSEKASIKYHTPNLNYQQRPLSSLLLAVFFFFSISSECKSPEQMLWKRLEKKWGRWRGGQAERKRSKRKKHKLGTKQPSWCTFATASQWSHPVFLWGCVWTKRSLKSSCGTVLWASLRPLLSPCKNVPGDYRKCYRIQS